MPPGLSREVLRIPWILRQRAQASEMRRRFLALPTGIAGEAWVGWAFEPSGFARYASCSCSGVEQ